MAVKKIISVGLNTGCDRSMLQTSIPFLPGIITSNIMRSGMCCFALSKASLPFFAVIISYPSAVRLKDKISKISGSSSAIRIFLTVLII